MVDGSESDDSDMRKHKKRRQPGKSKKEKSPSPDEAPLDAFGMFKRYRLGEMKGPNLRKYHGHR